MESIVSFVRDAYLTVITIFRTISSLNSQYQELLRRAVSPPALPVAHPTSSYWLDEPPFPELCDMQNPLPELADVVIIGSGITAAAAARTLLELDSAASSSSPLRVCVLEARQICSGATGRNGGHIKCAPYEAFAALRRVVGPQRARELVRFQRRHLDVLLEVGQGMSLAEVREVETVDLYVEEGDFGQMKEHVAEAEEWLPEEKFTVWEGERARDKFGTNEMVVGAVSYRAGALWPYRLVTSVWHELLEKHGSNLLISTHTPAEAITTDDSSHQHPYKVSTPRGHIHARHVLHATNAFAASLVPSLRGKLTGVLAHMTAQTPPTGFSSSPLRSCSIIYSPGFDYVTQRANGDLMVGGGLFRSRAQGLDQVGVWDDGRVDALPAMHLRGCVAAVYGEGGPGGGRVKKAWTGILGVTGDTMPLVGRIPAALVGSGGDKTRTKRTAAKDKQQDAAAPPPGQWIAAGFNGEGMVWAWLCGTAVAVMMLGREHEELGGGVGRPGGKLAEWFPERELRVDEQRMRSADLRNLAGQVM